MTHWLGEAPACCPSRGCPREDLLPCYPAGSEGGTKFHNEATDSFAIGSGKMPNWLCFWMCPSSFQFHFPIASQDLAYVPGSRCNRRHPLTTQSPAYKDLPENPPWRYRCRPVSLAQLGPVSAAAGASLWLRYHCT